LTDVQQSRCPDPGQQPIRKRRTISEQVAPDIDRAGIRGQLIKPNFVVTHKPLAATQVDAVRLSDLHIE
jgi:hypothetical protein